MLHETYDFLELGVVVLPAFEYAGIFKGFLLERDKHAGYDLFPLHGLGLEAVGHNVVNVLYKDYVGIDFVEVLYQRAMTGGPEEQRAVTVAEQGIVGVHRHGVC